MNKFRSKKTEVDGITFASKAEAARYQTLKLELANGIISDLELQPKFPIIVDGVKVCTYIADFSYNLGGRKIVEDVKGFQTPLFKLKAKLFKIKYKIDLYLTK